VEKLIKELEDLIKGDDKAAIEAKTQELAAASQEVAQAQQAGAAGAAAGAGGATSGAAADDDVVDAEFEEVKDDKK